jgi:hypothetical protein
MHVKRRSLARLVRAADAPKALKGRTARRAWASEFNRVARTTADQEVARRAGADLAMAVIDCDATVAAHVSRSRRAVDRQPPPFTLSQAAERRARNDDGAGDCIRDAILRDEALPFTAADRCQDAQKRHGSRSFIRGKALPE